MSAFYSHNTTDNRLQQKNNGNNSDNNKTESKEALELSVYAGVDDLEECYLLLGIMVSLLMTQQICESSILFGMEQDRFRTYDVSKIIERTRMR